MTARKLSTRRLGITFLGFLLSASIILPGCASGPREFLGGLFGGGKQSLESDSGKTQVADNDSRRTPTDSAGRRLTPPDDRPGRVRIVSNPPVDGRTVAEKGKVLNPFIRKRTPIADATQDPFLNRFAELDSQLQKAQAAERANAAPKTARVSKQSVNPFEQFEKVSKNAGRTTQPTKPRRNVKENLPVPAQAGLDQRLASINSRKLPARPSPQTKKPTAEELAAALLRSERQNAANSAPAANRSLAQDDSSSRDRQHQDAAVQPLGGLFGEQTTDGLTESAAKVHGAPPVEDSVNALQEMVVDSKTIAPRFHLDDAIGTSGLNRAAAGIRDGRPAAGQPSEFQQSRQTRPVHGALRDSGLVRVSANRGGLVRLERPVGLSRVRTADNAVEIGAPTLLSPNQGAGTESNEAPAPPETGSASTADEPILIKTSSSTLEPVKWDDASPAEAERKGQPISLWLIIVFAAAGLLALRKIHSRRTFAR